MNKAMTILAAALAALPISGAAQSLPSSVDLRSDLPPVGDQQYTRTPGWQMCQYWASAYYTLTAYIHHFRHPEWDLSIPQYQFSPGFVPYNYMPGTATNRYYALELRGCTDMAEWPYTNIFGLAYPTMAQRQAALPYRVTGIDVLWDYGAAIPIYSTSQELMNRAKGYLANGYVLDAGLSGDDWLFPDLHGYPAMDFYDPDYPPGAHLTGLGHQVALCGYDDNINPSATDPDHRGGFLMVNEWGANWNGNMHGFLWLSYAYVKAYVGDCTAITNVVSDIPVITSCDLTQARVGDALTISGNSFGAQRRAAKVTVNGLEATNSVFINDLIVTTIPAGATSGPVIVYNWEGTPSNPIQLTIITTVTLAAGKQGGDIVLRANGTAGKSLLFSTSTNLVNWAPWVQLPNPSGTVQVTDPAPAAAWKFYRVEQQ